MVSRARFITGAKVTNYTNEYKKRIFSADRPGRCHICTQEYAKGDPMKWAPRIRYQNKHYLPVHAVCADWKTQATNNQPTEDGGYEVAPGTPTRAEKQDIAKRNRQLDKRSVFNRK